MTRKELKARQEELMNMTPEELYKRMYVTAAIYAEDARPFVDSAKKGEDHKAEFRIGAFGESVCFTMQRKVK